MRAYRDPSARISYALTKLLILMAIALSNIAKKISCFSLAVEIISLATLLC